MEKTVNAKTVPLLPKNLDENQMTKEELFTSVIKASDAVKRGECIPADEVDAYFAKRFGSEL